MDTSIEEGWLTEIYDNARRLSISSDYKNQEDLVDDGCSRTKFRPFTWQRIG